MQPTGFLATAALPLILGAGGVIAVYPAGLAAQGPASARIDDRARVGVVGEAFLPAQPDIRDFRVFGFAVELEQPLGGGFWLRGSLGPVIISGERPPPCFGVPCDERDRDVDDTGVSFAAVLRFRPMRLGPVAPLIEGGGGTLFTTGGFPPGGTWWNLSYRYGGGLDIALGRRLSVVVAYRYVHFSNAKDGRFENPAYNGRGFAVSLAW